MIGTSFTDSIFWLNFVYFAFACGVAFTIPGFVFLRRGKLTLLQYAVLATMLGIVLWGIQGYVFGMLHMRVLSYVYLGACLLIASYIRWKNRAIQTANAHPVKFDVVSFLLLFAGCAIQIFGVWFMGTHTSSGLVQCCGHAPDNNLELALINEIVHRFPPYEPAMFGVLKQNYHYWSHLVIAELIRVFHLPLIATTYQYMSLTIAFGLGTAAIVLTELLALKKSVTRWLLFFLYFYGELTYIPILLLTGRFDFSVGSLENSTQFLMNYPRAMAMILLFGALSFLVLWVRQQKTYFFSLFALFCSVLIGYKVYVGFFALVGLGSVSLYALIRRRYEVILPAALALAISIGIYLPVNYGAGGLIYTGLWRIENFSQIPQFGVTQSILALDIYRQHGNIPRLIEYELLYALLFAVSSFGLKLLGLIQTKKSVQLFPRELHIFLLSGIMASVVLGMGFVQKTGGGNTFNFLVTVILVGSLYTAVAVSELTSRQSSRILKFLIIAGIVILSMPRIIYATHNTAGRIMYGNAAISNAEFEALQYVKNNTPSNALLLVDPRMKLSDYDGPDVSYLTDRPTYYSGIINELIAHGIKYTEREKIVRDILSSPSPKYVAALLTSQGINYILTAPQLSFGTDMTMISDIVFTNSDFTILKIR